MATEQAITNHPDDAAMFLATTYARELAVSLWEKHWKATAPNWKPLDDLYGILTQIDNMTCGMVRK
jgi:hypothetical protein